MLIQMLGYSMTQHPLEGINLFVFIQVCGVLMYYEVLEQNYTTLHLKYESP